MEKIKKENIKCKKRKKGNRKQKKERKTIKWKKE